MGEQQCVNSETTFFRDKLPFPGRLIVTSYKLVFVPNDRRRCGKLQIPDEYLNVPLGTIAAVEKVSSKKFASCVCFEVQTKDGRRLDFMFPPIEKDATGERIFNAIQVYAFSGDEKFSFAFSYKSSEYANVGWTVYQPAADYARMGIDFASKECAFRAAAINLDPKFCPTYPQLVVVPKAFSDKDLERCARSWANRRFPVLSYFHAPTGCSLWRSGEERGTADGSSRKLVAAIVGSKPKAKLLVLDVRSRVLESEAGSAGYPGCVKDSCHIEDTQKIRESFIRFQQLCNDEKHDYCLCITKWVELSRVISGTHI